MDIGNPTIYKCPACKKPMLEETYTSDSFYSTAIFSDGRRRRYPLYPRSSPDLAKCPNCGALFFVHNLKGKETDFEDDTTGYKNIQEPEREDYIKAVEQKLYKTPDEETEARRLLWLGLNDIMRDGGKFNAEQMKLWQENCAALLPLLKQSFAEKPEKYDRDGFFNGLYEMFDGIEYTIAIADLHRNLEQFDECVKTINTLPKEKQPYKDKFLQHCKSRNRFVFVLKPHDDYEEKL